MKFLGFAGLLVSLAVANAQSNTSIFLPTVAYDAGGFLSQSLAVVDFDGDGKLDVIATSSSGGPGGQGAVGVLLGKGDGTFATTASYDPGQCSPLSVAVGDLNGDGKPDIVTATPGCVAVSLQGSKGTLKTAVTYPTKGKSVFSGADIFNPVLIVDINHDGKPDIVVLNPTDNSYGDGSIGVLLGNGDGTFQPVVTYDSGGFDATSFAIADLNGDGNVDLVVANCGMAGTENCGTSNGAVAVLLGNGDGTFGPAHLFDAGGAGSPAAPVAVADLNGDGKPDIIVGNTCTTKVRAHSCEGVDGTIGVLLGVGDGSFKSVKTYDCGGYGVTWMEVVDVDGDGKLDVVAATGTTSVLRGKGDGTFHLPARYPSVLGVFAVADVNGDGTLDLITANTTSNTVTALIGNGNGFSGPVFFPSGGVAILSEVVAADLNDDGRADVLALSWCTIGPCAVGSDEEGALGVLLANPAFADNGTTTMLIASASPAPPNQTITYTAKVSAHSSGPLTGSVEFFYKNKLVGEATLVNNQASIAVDYVRTGTYGLQATYTGDSTHGESTSPTHEEFIENLPVTSKTSLTASPSPSLVGEPVTFTATVTSQFGNIPDGETVTFSAGSTVLGTSSTVKGVASLTAPLSVAKSYTIKATYSGDTDFKPSSQTVTQVVHPNS